MLEVLIAILVLSVGLFAMLGLMTSSMKMTATSNYRAMATQMAYEMSDYITSDAPIVYGYDSPTNDWANNSCFGSGCPRADLLSTEVQMWQDQLAVALPKGAGTVCRSTDTTDGIPGAWLCSKAGSQDPFVVKICWDETRIGVHKGSKVGTPYFQCIYTQQ